MSRFLEFIDCCPRILLVRCVSPRDDQKVVDRSLFIIENENYKINTTKVNMDMDLDMDRRK